MKTFRKQSKVKLQLFVPPAVAMAIRVKAVREQRSTSETATEVIALALGLNPATYGIEVPDGR